MHSVEYCRKIPRDHAIALNFSDRQAKAHKEMNVRPSQHEARHDTQREYPGNNSTSTKNKHLLRRTSQLHPETRTREEEVGDGFPLPPGAMSPSIKNVDHKDHRA